MPSPDNLVRLIVNPVAAHGGARRIAKELIAKFQEQGVPHIIRETEGRGHATEIAAEWVREGAEGVWCLGGDGTVRETVQSVAGTPSVLGIIPGGTGNDFAATLGLKGDPWTVFDMQRRADPRSVDIARFNDQWFVNICGTGFDSAALLHTEKAKRYVSGMLAYLVGVVRAISTHKDMALRLVVDGKKIERTLMMVSICNGQRFGGGMRVAPQASVTDGLFDLILVHPVSRLGILRLLPRFIKGRHIGLPQVEVMRCREVRVSGGESMLINADGELISCGGAYFSIQPMALKVFAPA